MRISQLASVSITIHVATRVTCDYYDVCTYTDNNTFSPLSHTNTDSSSTVVYNVM